MRTTWPKFTEVRRELHVQAHQRVATERRAVLLQLIKTLPATARTQAVIAAKLGTSQAAVSRELTALGLCAGCFRPLKP